MSEIPETDVRRTGPIVTGIVAALLGMATLGAAWLGIERLRAHPEDGWEAFILSLLPGVPALIFAGMSAVMAADVRKQRAIAERRAASPDEPWLWSETWRHGQIRSMSEGISGLVLAILGVVLFTAGTWPLAILMRQGAVPPPAWILGAVFTAAGLVLMGLAVHFFLAARKYPRAAFEMSVLPGTLGGPLKGTIQLPPEVPGGTEVTVTLTCTGTGRGRSSSNRPIHYQDEVRVPALAGSVPIDLTIPFDVPQSEPPGSKALSWCEWDLGVSASVPGVDYSAIFTVPVFATPASNPSLLKGTVDVVHVTERPTGAKTIVEAGRERTVFALARVKGLGCGAVAFLLSLPVAWGIVRYADSDRGPAFQAAGLAVLAGAGIASLVWLLTPTRLEIHGGAIRQDYGLWRTRAFPLADVAEITYDAAQATQVSAVMKDGRRRWLVIDMSGPAEAKWLAAELTRAVERHRGSPARG